MIHYLVDVIVIGNRIIDYITPSYERPMLRRMVLTLIGLLIMLPTAVGAIYLAVATNLAWWSWMVIILASCIMTIGAIIAVKD